MSPVSAKAWHSQPADEVLAQLGSAVAGLSAQEAARRLAADGLNERTEGKRIRPLQIFAALVFAELLRSVGARSETRPIWRMNFFSNFNLLAILTVPLLVLEVRKVWIHRSPAEPTSTR